MSDRAFEIHHVARLLETHNHGDDANALNGEMHDLLEKLAAHAAAHGGTAKGAITVTLEFAVDRRGVDVALTYATKRPKRPKSDDRYFLTEDGRLTLRDPARGTMFEGADLGRIPRGA